MDLREITLSRMSDATLLRRFYSECLVPAFPDPDQCDSLEDIEDELRKKERG